MPPIEVQPHIAQMGAYAPPWTGLDRKDFLRLDLNECTRPLPQCAIDAVAEQLPYAPLYPDYQAFGAKLSEYSGVPPECLMVTNGSDQGIDVILRAFLAPGDTMAVARPEFPMFGQIAGVLNAQIAGVPYGEGFRFPYEVFAEAITPRIRLAVVINPNNPTGTPVELDYIEGLLRDHPATPFLVDEAYFEFTGATIINLISQHPNLIVLRTFSKAFAMAGMRLGYIAAQPELIGQFLKIRGPFDANSLALAAAAAQIDTPQERIDRTEELMERSKPLVESFFESHGVVFHRGSANFFLVESSRRDAAVEFLKAAGILVRPMYADQLQGMIRMSLGTVEEMQRFTEAYASFLETP